MKRVKVDKTRMVVVGVPRAHILALKLKAMKQGRTMAALTREWIEREIKE